MREGRIVVVGSAVVDLTFTVETLPFPGETAAARDFTVRLGGKGANQAVAARRMGAPVLFLGRVGDDDEGRATVEDLEGEGVEARLLVTEGTTTGRAAVLVDEEGENLIGIHAGANARLAVSDVEALHDELAGASVYVAQCEVPLDASAVGARIARASEVPTILNAAPYHSEAVSLLDLFDVLVLNRVEAERTADIAITTPDDALAALRALVDMGAPQPVITLGALGLVFIDHGRGTHVPPSQVATVDATGAGDAFVGALAAWLREEIELEDAVRRAAAYASLSTTKPGTRASFPDRQTFDAWDPTPR
jgi:ribokinase